MRLASSFAVFVSLAVGALAAPSLHQLDKRAISKLPSDNVDCGKPSLQPVRPRRIRCVR